MATQKRAKAKTKKKSTKKSAKPRPASSAARKKSSAVGAKRKPQPAKTKATMRRAAPALPAKPTAAAATAATDRVPIGVVVHFYSHLSVAIVRMERGSLRVGDSVHIKGHTTDLQQRVESMEIDHVRVAQVGAKQEFGMRVSDHVREHDVVYKLAATG